MALALADRQPEKELLDHLPPDEPNAQASRRDLRRINTFMGSMRFIRRSLGRLARPGDRILELGAGEASLGSQLPTLDYTGLDTAPPPRDNIQWRQTDAMTFDDFRSYEFVVANLILHHFENEAIRSLARRILPAVRGIVVVEPWRHRFPAALMHCAHPFVHPVTRHDSAASIRAGFRPGELPSLLGLDAASWNLQETPSWRGAIRMVAWKSQ